VQATGRLSVNARDIAWIMSAEQHNCLEREGTPSCQGINIFALETPLPVMETIRDGTVYVSPSTLNVPLPVMETTAVHVSSQTLSISLPVMKTIDGMVYVQTLSIPLPVMETTAVHVSSQTLSISLPIM